MTYPILKISRSTRTGVAALAATALLRKVLCILLLTAGLAGIRSVHADTTYDGSISGIFSDPLLTGDIINVDGSHTFFDNTTTAVYSGVGTNTITWGATGFSTITFTGNSFSGVQPNQPFELGTITYTNGTSGISTVIFGGTLTLTVNSPTGPVTIDPSVSLLNFVTTVNGGTDQRRDADFVSFDAFPQTFNVFEGATATAQLFGEIIGDPTLVLTGIQLAPGQTGNGFIGHGQPAVPDGSSTLGLMGLALGALAVLGIKTKRGQSQRP